MYIETYKRLACYYLGVFSKISVCLCPLFCIHGYLNIRICLAHPRQTYSFSRFLYYFEYWFLEILARRIYTYYGMDLHPMDLLFEIRSMTECLYVQPCFQVGLLEFHLVL